MTPFQATQIVISTIEAKEYNLYSYDTFIAFVKDETKIHIFESDVRLYKDGGYSSVYLEDATREDIINLIIS